MPASRSSTTARTVLIDPFLTSQPEGGGERRRARRRRDPAHPRALRPLSRTSSRIAQRTGATVVAITEIADELRGRPRRGPRGATTPTSAARSSCRLGLGASSCPRWHTSTTPKGTVNTPAGLVIELGGTRVYHLGDTCAVQRPAARQAPRRHRRRAHVPIGGHYTMDRHDAVVAAELGRRRTRSSRATTTRSRRSRPTRRRSSPRSRRPGRPRSSSSRPGRRTTP